MIRFRDINLPEVVIIASIIFAPAFSFAAERSDTESVIKQIVPPISVLKGEVEEKDVVRLDAYYEKSDIIQGSRTGRWIEQTDRFNYTHGNITGYASFTEYRRFDNRDYTWNFGSYINMKDSYVHIEEGFGWSADYMYKFQSITEYGHKLRSTLFWQLGYSYRAYGTDDTHIIYPGLIYYFGDSYMSIDYGVSMKEGNDTANFGSVKGDFAVTKFLHWWCGVAFGERLYDIFEYDAHEEYGYILYTGLTLNVYKGIYVRAGYSYGFENPKFIKRGLNFSASVKF